MEAAFAPEAAIDRAALEELSRRSDTRGVVQLAGHCGALAATGTLVAPRIAVQAPGYIAVHREIIGAFRRS